MLQQAFVNSGVKSLLNFVRDGSETIRYLTGQGGFENRQNFPFPGLILLDLKMPKLNGFEVLQWVRKHPELKRLLIVVLTSSAEPCDVDLAYELGANSYLRKPSNFNELVQMMGRIETYWLETNIFPTFYRI